MFMKRLVEIICIGLIIVACQPTNNKQVKVILEHEKKDGSHLLVLTVVNNTSAPIYIPRLASLMTPIDSIRFFNSKGEIINEQLVIDELSYGISFYGPPRDGKVITDYCSDEPYISEYIDLELPPFTQRKMMIRSIVQYEYERLILEDEPKMLIEEDINFIKSLIFSKYCNSIFLKPNETYSNCITINTLSFNKDFLKIYLHYTPSKEYEEYKYKLKFDDDSIRITSDLIKKFEGYSLFDRIIKSDTLFINF